MSGVRAASLRTGCILLLFLIVATSGASIAQAPANQPVPEKVHAAGADSTLVPGDVLRIAVWREPDLSGEFPVDENGSVTLPLLGKVNLRLIPLSQLRDRLIERYAVELNNASITVTPLRRVYVLGEVMRPGLYAVDPTISLAGAVALAGGATPNGDLERLRIIRNGAVVLDRAEAIASLTAVNVRSEDQIIVDRRGWFDRNSTFAASALISIASLIITLRR